MGNIVGNARSCCGCCEPEPLAADEAYGAEPLPPQDVAEEAIDAITGAGDHQTQMELHIKCSNLRKTDGPFGKSDPFAIVYESVNEHWIERGRTELIVNTQSPTFVESVVVAYSFQVDQKLAIRIYDCDEEVASAAGLDHRKQTYLGTAEFSLGEAVKSAKKEIERELAGPNVEGTCTVTVNELADFKKDVSFTIQAHNLSSSGKAKLTSSDPFVQVCKPSRTAAGVMWVPVFSTGVQHSEKSPRWDSLSVALGRICGGDVYAELLWVVMDWEKSGKHCEIGRARASVDKVLKLAEAHERLPLFRHKQMDSEGAKSRGELEFTAVTVREVHSFLDHVHGGLNIDFTVAIDFTASNGDPEAEGSLHGGDVTDYETAIRGVGRVLDFYNLDKMYTAYAFGVKVGGAETSHCYPLNGRPASPQVDGVDGIISAYKSLLQRAELSGPTHFAPVIDAACAQAKAGTPGTRYTCLLILTDGEITDLNDSISAVSRASKLPLSILIVGIGRSSFATAATLDCDEGFLRSESGSIVTRDVVQFVPFRDVSGDGASLAKAVLSELPGQLLMYMRTHKVKPGTAGKNQHATLEPTIQ